MISDRASSFLRRRMGRALAQTAIMAVGAICVAVTPLAAQAQASGGAQQPPQQAEIEQLRLAQELEAAGDIAGAEAILIAIVTERPGSLSGLLSLERLLRVQGRFEEALPYIERFLAEDPASPIAHQMALRSLSALDRVDDIERAERRWIEATPGIETPYREAARVWDAREDRERALRVLREGRQRLGEDALAWEIGGIYAVAGDTRRAIDEWSRAIGTDAERFHLVQRRLAMLPDGGAAIVPGLIARLRQTPTTPERLRAALSLAIEAGIEEQAFALAQHIHSLLSQAARPEFLLTTGREADASRQPRLAHWAYRVLLQTAPAGLELDAVRRRLSELAVMVGDSATARATANAAAASAPPGTALARQAEARRIELEATVESLDASIAAYRTFREAHGDAPEVDRLAAALGALALRAGRIDDAAAIVDGVRGGAAAGVRARIALHRGEPAAARAAFQQAATGLTGRAATDVIAYATLLARATPAGARRLGSALDRLETGDAEAAIDALAQPSLELRADERASLLDLAARIADAEGLGVRAESLRRTLIDEHPRAQEAASALLGLARALAQRPDGAEEARALLERLILEHPRSALVPQARRLLAEVTQRVPAS